MKAETNALLEQARRALAAAWRDLDAEDADHAVAHAYYAAFHAATAALNEAGLSARSHQGTHNLFYQEYVENGKVENRHSRTLSFLFQSRQEADYTTGITFSLDDAADAIQQAEAFVEAVTALLSS